MKENESPKKEKKVENGWFYGILTGQTNSEGSLSYCTQDQCFINNPHAFSSTDVITSQIPNEFHNVTLINEITNSIKLTELFSPELIQVITTASQQGLLISLLITLANEGITDYLQNRHCHPNKIYWANQAIRALLLIALGNSVATAIATPIAGYALNSYGGVNRETSHLITTRIVWGINFLTSPLGFVEAAIGMGTSIGAGLLGNQIAKSGYNFMRNTFFKHKEVEPEAEISDKPFTHAH